MLRMNEEILLLLEVRMVDHTRGDCRFKFLARAYMFNLWEYILLVVVLG
jgi:hypothetical protein